MLHWVEDMEELFTMNHTTGNRLTNWNQECEDYIRGYVFKN
jgi:hypothetical protein